MLTLHSRLITDAIQPNPIRSKTDLGHAIGCDRVVAVAAAARRGGAAQPSEPMPVDAVDVDPLVDLHQLRPLFVRNESSGRWEIPQQRTNFFRPDSFLVEKPTGLRRIFVLGGSTVQGRPYATETAFSTWLKLRLQAASPETDFEVVNCGGVSYASYRVARILDEVLRHEPDAIVVYTGHNEFLEDREYADVRELSPLLRGISMVAAKIRLVTWIQSKLSPATGPKTVLAGEVDTRLDHVGGLDRYVRDPRWRTGVERHFAETLRGMIQVAESADVPLILCVPASDLVRTPPFKVATIFAEGTPQAAQFESVWNEATETNLSIEARLAACDDCLRLDPEHAGANFIAGRLRYEQGELPQAKPLLINARDFDVCPLRATSPIVDAVVTLAHEQSLPLIDTERLLDERDYQGRRVPDGIPDPRFFVDHVHPSIAGHQLIGNALFAEIARLGWFDVAADAEQRYEQLSQQHLDSLGEEYYARGSQRLEGLRRWATGRAGQKISDEAR